jgi:integrase
MKNFSRKSLTNFYDTARLISLQMATINQRPTGSFQVSVMLRGKRFRKDFRTMQEAEIFLAELNLNRLRGVVAHPTAAAAARPRLWRELQSEVMKRCWKGTKGENTARINSNSVVSFFGSELEYAAIENSDVDAFVEHLRSSGRTPATANRHLSALSKMLSYAKQRGWMDKSLVISREEEKNNRLRWLTADEEELLLLETNSMPNKKTYADLWAFLIDTGARVGEALKLNWKDVDFDNRKVTFRDTKNGDDRTIPMTKRVFEILFNSTKTDPPFNLAQPSVNYVWQQVKTRMGLLSDSEFVPHALRHTCASRLVQRNVPLFTVMKFLGHKSFQITQRYAHLSPSNLSEAVEALEPTTNQNENV